MRSAQAAAAQAAAVSDRTVDPRLLLSIYRVNHGGNQEVGDLENLFWTEVLLLLITHYSLLITQKSSPTPFFVHPFTSCLLPSASCLLIVRSMKHRISGVTQWHSLPLQCCP
ncbi:MAG: hypothetical protein F6K41_29450 [Symploca sp. SIO3E6]|nr:hypothetical protein [Caldora sp. SIO3E6]